MFTAVLNFSHVVALAVDGRGKAVQSVVAELISALCSRCTVLPLHTDYVAVVAQVFHNFELVFYGGKYTQYFHIEVYF